MPMRRLVSVMAIAMAACLAQAAYAQTDAAADKVLAIQRDLLLSLVRICGEADIAKQRAQIPAFSEMLKANGMHPEHYSAESLNQDMLDFSAWGLDADLLPADRKDAGGASVFVEIRTQVIDARPISRCVLTDSSIKPELVVASWAEPIGAPLVTIKSQQISTDPNVPWSRSLFDLSTDDALWTLTISGYEVKSELEILRVGLKPGVAK